MLPPSTVPRAFFLRASCCGNRAAWKTTIPVLTCFMSLKYWLYSGRWWIQIRSDFLPTALLGHAVSPVLVPSKWFILEGGASYLPVDIFHLFNSSWLKWNILPLSLQGFQDIKYGISTKKIHLNISTKKVLLWVQCILNFKGGFFSWGV